ncbi:hypothetical protein [Solibacillus faecavium]|uniref:hypothetical protein n=1 Tax=Solibacillus TaxID=648800 RepID=UPI001CD828FD|nr:hypothetical protein [Solibacillus faecavium]
MKNYNERSHVEAPEQDKSIVTVKESYNRLPDERNDEEMKNYNERSHVEEVQDKELITEKESYNRLPDEPVQETSVHEQYKSGNA